MGPYRQRLARWSLLSILSCGLLLGATASAWADDAPPPPGLTAVSQPIPMPSFSLPSIDGSTVDSEVLKDKVAVVRFWATW